MSGFDALAEEIHAWARGKGFYDRERLEVRDPVYGDVEGRPVNPSLPSEKLMLVVTEVAEVQEALRDGDREHEAEEVADVVIRLLDYAAWRGISLDREIEAKMAKNRERPRLHGRAEFAHEMGVRFQDVVCRRRYLRLLTRQESYDARAADEADDTAVWDWADTNGYVYRDGEYRDGDGNPHEPPPFDRAVPADWESQEEDPVWEFCDRSHPGAIPCWRLESKS